MQLFSRDVLAARIIAEKVEVIMRILVILLLVEFSAIAATVNTVNLGTADSFAVLGGSGVTNTGSSVVFGNLGVSAGGVVSGFPPGIVKGTTSAGDAVAAQAQTI
jgi:hypothetical protein